MNKKTIIIVIVIVAIVCVGLGALLALYVFDGGDSPHTTKLTNPVANLTDEQAIELFDESFILYLLYSIDANELHNPPFSKNTPKIQINLGEDIYNAEVIDHMISVGLGEIPEKDITITTSKQEAVKMLRSQDYVKTSFEQGLSSVELIKSEAKLALKGYLNVYEKISGEE